MRRRIPRVRLSNPWIRDPADTRAGLRWVEQQLKSVLDEVEDMEAKSFRAETLYSVSKGGLMTMLTDLLLRREWRTEQLRWAHRKKRLAQKWRREYEQVS